VATDVGQEALRIAGREVTDRRSGIEEQRRIAADVEREIEAVGEIGDDSREREVRKFGRHPRERPRQRVARDVDGDVARRGQERQPAFRLAAVAGAKVDELAAAAHQRGDLVAVLREDRSLGARRVVFGQLADCAEKRAADAVVKVLGRDRRMRVLQTAHQRASLSRWIARQAIDKAIIRHGGTMLLRHAR